MLATIAGLATHLEVAVDRANEDAAGDDARWSVKLLRLLESTPAAAFIGAVAVISTLTFLLQLSSILPAATSPTAGGRALYRSLRCSSTVTWLRVVEECIYSVYLTCMTSRSRSVTAF